jgi:16S rRNA (adenine1518-N6/adenine1519-N6)-dimethyltransferase
MSSRAKQSAPSRRPRKSLGQHFLIDPRVANRIVSAAALTASDTVVEVGPGTGILTRRLVARAGRVVAIELDQRLASELPPKLGGPDNLTVLNSDARHLAIGELVGVGTSYKMVANLPYYAAAPIMRHFLESDAPPTVMVVMVQREVGEAMVATPGTMTLMSVATQFYASASVVTHVPPRAFRPAPKVSSTVVKLDVRQKPAIDVEEIGCFFDLVRAGFTAPRKQLRNSLMQGTKAPVDVVSRVLSEAGIDSKRRPATLSIEEWGLLENFWPDDVPRHRAR